MTTTVKEALLVDKQGKAVKPMRKEDVPLIQMHSFEAWLKVVVVNQVVDERSTVMEFNCVDGADGGKWKRAKVKDFTACGMYHLFLQSIISLISPCSSIHLAC